MSYISRSKIYCPKELRVEVKVANRQFAVIWISGDFGTWFVKYNTYNCKVTIDTAHIGIETRRLYNALTYYCRGYLQNWLPSINSALSLLCAIIKRTLLGAGVGFKRYLRVRGVGYKFELIPSNLLTAKVGYTHLVQKKLPSEFSTRFSRKSKVVRFRSKSLTKITSVLAHIRSMRLPDIYKGKGIRYKRDPIRRKPGKRKTKAVSKKRKVLRKHKIIVRRRRRRRKRKTRMRLFLFQRRIE